MMEEKTICLILNYNDYRTTIEMVNRIKDYKTLDQVLVVDNYSTDHSFEQLKQKFGLNKKVILIQTDNNGGYGFGNNFGVKFAKEKLKAKYVLLSNPDVSFSESMVEKLVSYMKKTDAAVVSARQRVNSRLIENPGWKIPTAWEWVLIESRLHEYAAKKYYYPKKYFEQSVSQVECVRGANFLLDATKFLNVGGYDERMFLYGEETLLGYKLKKKYYKSYVLNDVYYDHAVSSSITKSIPSVIKQIEITHNSKLVFFKYYLKINPIYLYFCKKIFNIMIYRKKRRLNNLK